MSSKGQGIAVYQPSQFIQLSLPTGGDSFTSPIVNCADYQYATLFLNVVNTSTSSQVIFAIQDQAFSGSGNFERSIENPVYSDPFGDGTAYQSNVKTNYKYLCLGQNTNVSYTFPVFGNYGVGVTVADIGDAVTPATVSGSLVLFKAV